MIHVSYKYLQSIITYLKDSLVHLLCYAGKGLDNLVTPLYPTKLLLSFPCDYSTQPNISSSSHVNTLPNQTSPLFIT